MTKKDYQLIADTINEYIAYMRRTEWGNNYSDAYLIELFTKSLESTNPRFRPGLFEEACLNGLESRKEK